MKRVRVDPNAAEELEHAALWYESQRIGLGVEFVAEFDQALDFIAATPLAAPVWKEDRPYRRKTLSRFPYCLFFLVEDEVVVVLAVAHTRRRPGYWLAR